MEVNTEAEGRLAPLLLVMDKEIEGFEHWDFGPRTVRDMWGWERRIDPEVGDWSPMDHLRAAWYGALHYAQCRLLGHRVEGFAFAFNGHLPERCHAECTRCGLEWDAPATYSPQPVPDGEEANYTR